ncbi:hypothetical protein K435DRAFT_778648 [Dendrothele bispora CBS 962.96]|uniref:RNI-like protein n=1 Tax=Dendrothele bispora (strain CBS 962.96) TaxID=1314807 RepID=A0A4S8M268_DENBC|nr:hypothetical protein K435DRAFT_778648 [Dendrothele bispora CBS 962.96]
MSKLEDVTISLSKVHGATDALEESREKDFLNHFLALGSLRALHLCGYHPFDHVAGVGFKWEQLTDLALSHTVRRPEDMLALSVALDILSRVKNLRSCAMRLFVEKDAIDQTRIGPAITLRSLQTLDLCLTINFREVSYANDASHIFNRLITPSLKILTIRSWIENTPPKFSVHIPFLGLLSQPSVKIEMLNIDCHINPRAYIDCLQLTPYLKSLSLNHCIGTIDTTQNTNQEKTYSYEEFFRSLSPPDGNSPALCPELERIQFINCTSLPDPMMLLDLLKARIEGGVQSSLGDAEYFNTWMRDNIEGDCHASKSRDSGVVSGIPIALKKSTLKMLRVKYIESFDRRTITAGLTGRVSRLREQGLDIYIRLLSANTKLEDFFWDKLRMDHLPDGSLEELVLWADGTELGKPGVEYYLPKGFH